MSLIAASLLVMSLAGTADAEMPRDFLKVESKAWSRWLVGIEILSIENPAGRFDKKGDVILAVHSPVKLFLDDGDRILWQGV